MGPRRMVATCSLVAALMGGCASADSTGADASTSSPAATTTSAGSEPSATASEDNTTSQSATASEDNTTSQSATASEGTTSEGTTSQGGTTSENGAEPSAAGYRVAQEQSGCSGATADLPVQWLSWGDVDGLGAAVIGDPDTSPGAVILVHQRDGSLCQFLPFARELADRGIASFVMNAGDSPIDDRLVAAQDYLAEAGIETLVLVGASRGGTQVLAGAGALDPAAALVISLSSPGGYRGMDPIAAVADLQVPVLAIAGEGDRGPAAALQDIEQAQPGAQIVRVPGSAHGVALVGSGAPTDSAEAVATAIDTALGG